MALRIGFIGLGIMGKPMAKNLLKAGFSLRAYNRSRPSLDEVVAAGAAAAATPRHAAMDADVVITIVTDSPDVEQVILGTDGVIEGVQPGAVVIDMSTIAPQVTQRIAARLAQAGAHMLDAPVTGGQWGAEAGTLAIMVGGEEEALARCRPVLAAMGQKIVHCGPSGMGQMMKLCNQIVVGINNLAMAEGIVFAAKAGLDLEVMVDVVGGGAGGSWSMANLAPRAIKRDFAPGFKVSLQQKDLRLALDAARRNNVSLPGTALVHQLYAAVEAQGLGEGGNQSLVLALERLADIAVNGRK